MQSEEVILSGFTERKSAMNQELVKLSKTISHALRHKPEEYGLTLDSEGWVPIQELLHALGQRVERWKNLQESGRLDQSRDDLHLDRSL